MKYNIPAFPRTFDVDIDNINDGSYPQNGMTLLDYFAANAMNGICSSLSTDEGWKTFCSMSEMKFDESGKDAIARQSYSIAAAMIEERKKYIP